MKIKKTLIFMMVSIFTIGLLVGCGSDDPDTDVEDLQEEETLQEDADVEEDVEEDADSSQASDVTITLLNSKGEITEGLETMAEIYKNQTGVTVEVLPVGTGESPYTKITGMYSAGNPPTMAILDMLDVVALGEEKAVDLSNEDWLAEVEGLTTEVNGTLYSFPFAIEGRGIIYNKTTIEDTLGREFDPATINSYDSFKELLEELVDAGMETPVVLSKEDWSLGSHHLQYIYEAKDGTNEGVDEVLDQLLAGELDLMSYDRFTQFVDTFDLLAEHNINGNDPLGAIYDQDPIYLVDGDVAFWFNGVWAWPNLKDAGATEDAELGFIPYVLGNDTEDFANTQLQASSTKELMVDNEYATEEEKQAALDFINWLVYDEAGQKSIVEDLFIIPAAANNPNSPIDPLGSDLIEHINSGNTFSALSILPSDHWTVLGAEMQKYLAGESTREELATSIEEYWINQN